MGRDGEKLATLVPPDEDARDRSIAAFRADLKALMDLLADPETDLFAPCGGSSAPGTTSRLDVETRRRGPARARDGPYAGRTLRGTGSNDDLGRTDGPDRGFGRAPGRPIC
jgi:hypothetical protein